MELEKAKKKCKEIVTTKFNNDYSIDSTDKEAIETVLQAQEETNNKYILEKVAKEEVEELLENSVSKDIIRENIEKYKEEGFEYQGNICTMDYKKEAEIDALQELLDKKE